MPRSVLTHSPAPVSMNECSAAGGGWSTRRSAAGPISDSREWPSAVAVLPLDVAAQRVGGEHVVDHRVPNRLCIEPQKVIGPQDPEIGAQLALVVEDHRVAAAARSERLDVVGDLALEELHRARAADHELRAIGAIDQSGGLGEQLVLAGRYHPSIVLTRPARAERSRGPPRR